MDVNEECGIEECAATENLIAKETIVVHSRVLNFHVFLAHSVVVYVVKKFLSFTKSKGLSE